MNTTALATPKATTVAGSLGLVLIAVTGWLGVLGPSVSDLDAVRSETVAASDQNTLLTAQLAQLAQQREQLPQTRRLAARLAEQFPATADQPGMFEAVTAAAVDAGIGARGVTTLAPTPPSIEGAAADAAAAPAATGTGTEGTAVAATPQAGTSILARQTVTVSVTGTYEQTERLLHNLEQMPRTLLISSVSVSASGLAGEFVTTVTGDMFVMPPVEDPGELVPAAAVAPPAAGTGTVEQQAAEAPGRD